MSELFRPDVYTVRHGDTLYAIAWRYERDVNDLIRWNDLEDPDRLQPGQRIYLAPSGDDSGQARVEASEAERQPPRTVGESERARDSKPGVVTPGPNPKATPDSTSTPGSTSTTTSGPGSTATSSTSTSTSTSSSGSAAESGTTTGASVDTGDWRWPAKGELVGIFSNGAVYGRGIDIAGDEGQAIHASAAGEVVYSGDGLPAYGPLIIIRHSREYLSAYAHNRRLFVGEGDRVAAGERIAEMGYADGERVLLHFEIRRDGEPVDPLDYLPGRE